MEANIKNTFTVWILFRVIRYHNLSDLAYAQRIRYVGAYAQPIRYFQIFAISAYFKI